MAISDKNVFAIEVSDKLRDNKYIDKSIRKQ